MTKQKSSDEAKRAVMQCQQRFWRALEHKDADLFAEVLAENFVCRSPGEADQDRTTFIATLTSIPLTILNVSGEAIAIQCVYRTGNLSLSGWRLRIFFNATAKNGK